MIYVPPRMRPRAIYSLLDEAYGPALWTDAFMAQMPMDMAAIWALLEIPVKYVATGRVNVALGKLLESRGYRRSAGLWHAPYISDERKALCAQEADESEKDTHW